MRPARLFPDFLLVLSPAQLSTPYPLVYARPLCVLTWVLEFGKMFDDGSKHCSNQSSDADVFCSRSQPLSRRICRGLGPSMRGGKEVLVHVYAGVATGVIGVLHGLPKRPDFARACQQNHASQAMGVERA